MSSKSTAEIEREVAEERAQLRETLQTLSDRMTFDDAWERAGAYVRENRGDLTSSLTRAAREKPLAVMLTGIGLAWLFFGPSQSDRREPSRRVVAHDDDRWESSYERTLRATRRRHGLVERGPVPARGDPGARGPSGDTTVANEPTPFRRGAAAGVASAATPSDGAAGGGTSEPRPHDATDRAASSPSATAAGSPAPGTGPGSERRDPLTGVSTSQPEPDLPQRR